MFTPFSIPPWMRVAGSWSFHLWLTCTFACVCMCVCICVLPSVHCPCSVLGCCRVPPFTLRSTTRTPVCLCCYCVCWLQFTQIWPYCRQVSLLWEVLQRDPGQQCDPGGRPGTAADVSYPGLGGWCYLAIILRDYQAVQSLNSFCGKDFQCQEQIWTCLSFYVFFFPTQHDIERSVWKEEKRHVGPWTVSTGWAEALFPLLFL